MPGTIVKCYCKEGDEVKEGQPIISLESMKMEFLIRATHDVKIKKILAKEAQFVQIGDKLVTFDEQKA